jgi:neutral trehalase
MEQVIIAGLTLNDFKLIIDTQIQDAVYQALKKFKEEDVKDKLLSPEETCKLFTPAISIPTLNSYCKKGLIKKYYLQGRTWYKYSEILETLQTTQRYGRQKRLIKAIANGNINELKKYINESASNNNIIN